MRGVPVSRILLALGLLLATSGCSTVGYYSQAINGHLRLMWSREPIEQVLADPDTTDGVRQRLQAIVEARQYAVDTLKLPDNDSYSTYVATGRRYITWNVVAAGEFSLRARTWCFPIAGCVSYKGYYDEADARAYADELRAENYDVSLGGATAYSTLGWFSDPVLDTMLLGSDFRYIGTLFHELAHQVLYVKDDSAFNEAFASFVEQEGLRRWLEHRGQGDRIAVYEAYQARIEDFVGLLSDTRAELDALYRRTDIDAPAMRLAKAAIFERMQNNYATLKAERWNGYTGYDNWFERDLNNARLVSVATYRRYVPAFAALYAEAGEDFASFYALARAVSTLEPAARKARLDALLALPST